MNALHTHAAAATEVTQMEPMLPKTMEMGRLLSLAAELRERAIRLTAHPLPGLSKRLTVLLQAMNAYYSSKIEGQDMPPADLIAALEADSTSDIAQLSVLVEAQLLMGSWGQNFLFDKNWRALFSVDTLKDIHLQLFSPVLTDDQQAETSCETPGQLRTQNEVTGMHMPPEASRLADFIQRWAHAYSALPDADMALIGLACAHHRLAWIHPFKHGNGRVARLHSQLVLQAMGLSRGLWSPTRGLAMTQQQYLAYLRQADHLRQTDDDGRGTLTEQGLVEWVRYYLGVCLDEIKLMENLLNVTNFKDRLETLLLIEEKKGLSGLKMEALIPLHYIAMTGPIERGQFKVMTGMAERSAERLIKALLDYKLLRSDTPKGKVYMDLPLVSLPLLMPKLWPAAE